jgi:CheY-like chemotaxis protein
MKTILVVDDEANIARILNMLLTSEGYQVVVAQHGQEALAALEKNAIDMVISDITMPILDGIELCHILQNHPTYKALPIILMTAMVDTFTQDQCDCAAFLYKPFPLETLLDKVVQLIGK